MNDSQAKKNQERKAVRPVAWEGWKEQVIPSKYTLLG